MALVALTSVAWIAADLSGLTEAVSLVAGFIPARVGDTVAPVAIGGGLTMLPWPVTPLTATLIHAGLLHIAFNMLMLLYLGRQVEMVLGPRLFALLYVLGAYAGAMGHWALMPGSPWPMVGASGAISAVFGAYAMLYSQQQVRSIGPIPARVVRMIWMGAGWIGLQALIAFAAVSGARSGAQDALPAIAVGAHIGGFIIGMLLVRPMLRWRFRHPPAGA